MPPIGPIKRPKLIRYLRQLGWTGPKPGGPHEYMINGAHKIRIPNPHHGDIDDVLLLRILQQAGIDHATWQAL